MDDIDRLLAKDYQPSDWDTIKAGFSSIGTQEHHFSIPCNGIYTTFDTAAVHCLTVHQMKGTKV